MPINDPDERREYNRRWIAARRTKWLKENGPCQICGTWDELEIHHKDPSQKEYNVAQLWTYTEEKRNKELIKCMVLCVTCHNAAHRLHGKNHTYSNGCRCPLCTEAHKLRKRAQRAEERRFQLEYKRLVALYKSETG